MAAAGIKPESQVSNMKNLRTKILFFGWEKPLCYLLLISYRIIPNYTTFEEVKFDHSFAKKMWDDYVT